MKKKLNQHNLNLSGKNAIDNSINQNWEQDNQAWWDWYVTLAENSNKKYKSIKLKLPSDANVLNINFEIGENDHIINISNGGGWEDRIVSIL